MELFINNKSGAPIYDQIYNQIKQQIISGALQPDEAMPSIRGLARDLRISVITTKRAYDELEKEGFNGIPVALLAVNNPIAVIFTAIFMSVLDIAGLQLTNLTAYNEYITDVIIAAIVYLSAFSLVMHMLLDGRKKKRMSGGAPADDAPVEPAQSLGDPELHPDPAITDPDAEAPIAEGGEQA